MQSHRICYVLGIAPGWDPPQSNASPCWCQATGQRREGVRAGTLVMGTAARAPTILKFLKKRSTLRPPFTCPSIDSSSAMRTTKGPSTILKSHLSRELLVLLFDPEHALCARSASAHGFCKPTFWPRHVEEAREAYLLCLSRSQFPGSGWLHESQPQSCCPHHC